MENLRILGSKNTLMECVMVGIASISTGAFKATCRFDSVPFTKNKGILYFLYQGSYH